MTSIEDELHESLLENDDLSATLESKTEQFTIVRFSINIYTSINTGHV